MTGNGQESRERKKGQSELEKQVWDYVCAHGMLAAGDRIVVGVSGGADSVCLLLLLREWRERLALGLYAVHVEHGIRGAEALADAQFVRELCARLQVPCRVVSRDVPRLAAEQGLTQEEAGRNARYEEFGRALREWGGTKLAVAHHRDDQAETLLLHLFRGCGLAGMCGMEPVRGRCIRPLLCAGRAQIEEWLAGRGIPWRTDATNASDAYARNRVRNRVLAEARLVNGRAAEHLAKACEAAAEAERYLTSEAERIFRRVQVREAVSACASGTDAVAGGACSAAAGPCAEDGNRPGMPAEAGRVVLDAEALCREDALMQKYVLRTALRACACAWQDIGAEHLRALLDLAGGKTGRRADLPGGVRAYKSYGRLCLERHSQQTQKPDGSPGEGTDTGEEGRTAALETACGEGLSVPIPGILELPDGGRLIFSLESYKKGQEIPTKTYTKWFDYDKIKGSLRVRTRRTGDVLTVNSEGGTKKLKDYFINEKIERAQRDRMLLLADGSRIAWVIGSRMSEEYKVTDETRRVLKVQADGGTYNG